MTNVTFSFETSPNTNPERKKCGGHGMSCPPRLKKWGGTSPVSPPNCAHDPAVNLTMNDCFHVYVLEFQTIFPCVVKTIWMCFAVARVCKSVDKWTFSVAYARMCHSIKPRTTGEFRNLECVCDRLPFPSDIPSQKTRTWVRHILSTSKVEDEKFESLAKQQREALNISFSFWECETCQVKFDLQHLAYCISNLAVDNKSKWSMCDVTTCTGDKRD